ncbi:hypothetical protein M0L20_16975 [Spirosoma sp. RP8]|uniref:Uncharacterized protein n=1 Tax=Spirosoma liriopis TaxID=2937440 RepID=A0ABT0HN14_9BACT|nr:hypothetical protein [Spirosoma liriopis]MCK8493562.1 hypothetical protein [Spirosoma liriopis]
MKKILARVELHKLTSENEIPVQRYTVLHEAMAAIQFYQKVQNTTTKEWYELPPAEYITYRDITVSDALNEVEIAASKTGRKYSVFVTNSTTSKWTNLKKIKK